MAKKGKKLKMAKEDLISRLPTAVLTHILSFIDTKSAVTTTFLSKRWNRLWISVPNLDFTTNRQSDSFVDRVLNSNNVVSVRNVCLDYLGQSYDPDRLHSWLASIAKRNAERIKLSFPFSGVYRLPDCFFDQSNLVELRFSYFKSQIPQSVCFPNLKTIVFVDFRLTDGESFKNLMIGCPALTDMNIGICKWNVEDTLYICSTTLRILELCVCGTVEDATCNVVIDATNVTSLTIWDWTGVRYDIRDVSSLVKVNLTSEIHIPGSRQIFPKISHVSEIFFALRVDQFFSMAMPVFHNLIKLTWEITEWSYLFLLFHCAPNLATCVIQTNGDTYDPCVWHEPIEVPSCFSSSLESVKFPVCIGENEEGEDEMQMISYILKNATVLKKLRIKFIDDITLESEIELLKKLLILERGSSACQVSYFRQEFSEEDE